MSIYIENFLLASNTMITLDALKKSLVTKYDIKDLGEVKTIIRLQITREMVTHIMKID